LSVQLSVNFYLAWLINWKKNVAYTEYCFESYREDCYFCAFSSTEPKKKLLAFIIGHNVHQSNAGRYMYQQPGHAYITAI